MDTLHTSTDIKENIERYTFDPPKGKVARYASEVLSISPTSHNTPFITESKMYPLQCYKFKETIDHETGFTRSQCQWSAKVSNSLWSEDNLISKF